MMKTIMRIMMMMIIMTLTLKKNVFVIDTQVTSQIVLDIAQSSGHDLLLLEYGALNKPSMHINQSSYDYSKFFNSE